MRLQLREAFDLIDQDGSGAIDVDELEEAFKASCHWLLSEYCTALPIISKAPGSCQLHADFCAFRYVMLCYVMLCYVMLCYVMLCYVMLCYVMLCYVMLCAVLCSSVLCSFGFY